MGTRQIYFHTSDLLVNLHGFEANKLEIGGVGMTRRSSILDSSDIRPIFHISAYGLSSHAPQARVIGPYEEQYFTNLFLRRISFHFITVRFNCWQIVYWLDVVA